MLIMNHIDSWVLEARSRLNWGSGVENIFIIPFSAPLGSFEKHFMTPFPLVLLYSWQFFKGTQKSVKIIWEGGKRDFGRPEEASWMRWEIF